MSNKMILKILLTLLGFSLVLFGLIGFVSNSFQTRSGDIEKYYNQHSLNDKNGLTVDSDNNIYIGELQTNSIQVYDHLGNFQYGFRISKDHVNWFKFGINEDKIHIITGATNNYFVFDKGELISHTKEFNQKELETKYNMNKTNYFETNNKVYNITPFNTVIIKDKSSNEVEKIHLNSPIWPFSIVIFWLIMVCGMGLIFITHRKLFFSMNNWKKWDN